MKFTKDVNLRDFPFWSGGKERADELSAEELDQIEYALIDGAPEDGYTETYINDLFWFEEDWIAGLLGYDGWEALIQARNEGEAVAEGAEVCR
jgi:hypothetical protein